ncbi:predicted phosphate starvation-inducible protein [Erythrobacter sp. NAP1]|nr:predicted phosphate starvation-inducible protein [Erythrobacter sp. NAP1]
MGRRPTSAIDPSVIPEAINPKTRADAPIGHGQARAELSFENQSLLGPLFGEFDANLVQVENRLGVYIHARGDQILIEGPEDAVGRARDTLTTMYDRLALGQDLDSGAIESLIAMSNEPTLGGDHLRRQGRAADHDPHAAQDHRTALGNADHIYA